MLAAVIAVIGAVPAGAAGEGGPVERPWLERTAGDTIIDGAACDLSALPIVTCPTLIEYTVIGTHVGRAELTAVGVATVDISRECDRPDGLTGVPARNDTEEVIVAADGSELYSQTFYENCVVVDDVGPSAIPSDFTGVRTITGGTGRFEGATGTVVLNGVDTAGATEMTAAGTITY